MPAKYNLYYILQEEHCRSPMPQDKYLQIRKNLEKYYEKIKPPWDSLPPHIRPEENNSS